MPQLFIKDRENPLDAELNASVLETVLAHRVPIHTSCGGVAACGLCRIIVLEGASRLTSINAKEHEHLGDAATLRGQRLACQARLVVDGQVRIEIPPVPDVAQRKQDKMTRMLKKRREERRQQQQQQQGPRGQRGRGRR